MIMAQPGKREIRKRSADGKWLVYRFDPVLDTVMQWEIVRVFDTASEAAEFAAPRRTKFHLAA